MSKYGVIYGGAQKNMGPAGLTLVIVRDDLLDRALPITPSAFHWKEQAASRLDAQHAADVLDLHRGARVRVAARAGRRSPAIEQKNIAKAKLLYDYLDESDFYSQRRRARRTARA